MYMKEYDYLVVGAGLFAAVFFVKPLMRASAVLL